MRILEMTIRLRQLFRRAAAESRMNEEIRFHIEMETEKNVREGMTPEAARRRAVLAFGGVESHKEDMRVGRSVPLIEDLVRDAGHGARSLRRSPGTSAIALITLAVAIGAGTVMFGVLNGVLLEDLAVRAEDEVVVLRKPVPAGPVDHGPVRASEFTALRERNQAFRAVAGMSFFGAREEVLLDEGEPVSVAGTWVTGNFFSLLGVVPIRGRILRPSDDVPGTTPVMVISYDFWQRYFGGDPDVVGGAIERDSKLYTIVGVLPRGFEFPKAAEFWIPMSAAVPSPGRAIYDIVGRLEPGVTVEEARDDYDRLLRELYGQAAPASWNSSPEAIPLREVMVGDTEPILRAASAAVALLLLIACVNVANLLLIRGSVRTQELAIRSALGAGRSRLVRQLLTESGILAAVGGILGIMLAFAAVRVLVALAPPELPRREMIEVDAGVLPFAVTVTALTALLAGLLPAFFSAAGGLGAWLRRGNLAISAGRRARVLRNGLVIGQISLAVVVVAAAGLLARSLVTLETVDLGFNEDRLVIVETSLSRDLVPDAGRRSALSEDLLRRVRAIPGVLSVTSLNRPPFDEVASTAFYTGERQDEDAQQANPMINLEVVGPDYFRTMEIPIREGRAFGERDREDAPRVAIVSQTVADHTWPGHDAIGGRIKLGDRDDDTEWYTVVGVVDDTRYRDLVDPQPTLYLLGVQRGSVPMTLAIGTRIEPEVLLPRIRAILRQLHPDWLLVDGASVDQLLTSPLARPRFSALLMGGFGAITLLLAALGIYGVVAATVRQRTREIGIRIALGARVATVRAAVLGNGLRLALLGCAIGIVLALAVNRVIRGLLFEISPTDPATLVGVVTVIITAAILACYAPARRASRVDPADTLRTD